MAAAQEAAAPPLRQAALARGITFGAAVRSELLRADPAYAALFAREATLLVPEWEAKWEALQPREGEFTFDALTEILNFAIGHNQRLRGHALVWHEAMPAWLPPAIAEGRARAQALLENHILQVLTATRDHIRDWDVLNEPVSNPPGSDQPSATDGDLRPTPWLAALGPAYLEMALSTARQVDRTLRITLNDYAVEEDTPWAAEKRARLLRVVRRLVERRAPLDAIGIQAHLQLRNPFSPAPFIAFVRALRELGLAVMITELDVREADALPDGVAARDAAVAERVQAFVAAAIEGGARTVITWGLTDRDSWLVRQADVARRDGVTTRPLPFDDQLRPKPFRDALLRAFGG
ncbi:MAG: endo-1,4-beta-xylanase [Acetobacteraceae bacterium]|nr:endo-1,4-beta-xylanase [Acetobacteraceae bacterium]